MTTGLRQIVRNNLALVFTKWSAVDVAATTGIKLGTVRCIKSRGIVCRRNAELISNFCGFSLYVQNAQAVELVELKINIPADAVGTVRKFCKEISKNA